MSADLLSIFLDFAVLIALTGTIYFALRLSKSLNNFRSHKNEMKKLMDELNRNINDAQNAIDGLKTASNHAATDLEDVLHDSRKMAEELKMINEASNNIADRLEGAVSNSKSASAPSYAAQDEEYFDEPDIANTDEGPVEPPSFFIQDREFEDGAEFENELSEAEKDLYEAIQNNKKAGKGRG